MPHWTLWRITAYHVNIFVCLHFKRVKKSNHPALKGQFQGQQTRGECGKKTLPAFECGECSLAAFDPSKKRIRT